MPENKTSAAARGAPIKETGPRGANAPPEPTEAPEPTQVPEPTVVPGNP